MRSFAQIGIPLKGHKFLVCTLNVLRLRLTCAIIELFTLYKIFNKYLTSIMKRFGIKFPCFIKFILTCLVFQAARKYDIPYPTFVLYANRVHNLLGPSAEPGDLRPKGRGRPQRILLGSWPEDQIKVVIRAVVFRDTSVFKDQEHKSRMVRSAAQ